MLTLVPAKPGESGAPKDRRLRAIYRRELVESVRASALVFAVAQALTLATFAVAGAPATLPAIVFGAVELGAALVIGWRAPRWRRIAVQLGMATGLLAMSSAVANGLSVPAAVPLVIAAVGMIPLAFSLFIPLERKPHLIWLALANASLLGGLALAGEGTAMRESLPSLVVAAAISTVVSLLANDVLARRRAQMNKQILAVRSLYKRMQEHELDLRRQDDFLLMQQETLVVQQAELLRLNEELESIARLDALTGLGNRLRLNEDLAQLAGRIERSGGTAGLLLLDLDRFKRLNDCSGHLAGDEALRGVAEVLRRTSRIGDGLYRYGGEEFLVVLHDCDESVLELAGQRYLVAIQAAAMSHPDNAPWNVVTASAGAAELSQRAGVDVDNALRAADEALYRAKAHGRNRLEVHATRGDLVVIEPRIGQRAAS